MPVYPEHEQAEDRHAALPVIQPLAGRMVERRRCAVFRGETGTIEHAVCIVRCLADGQALQSIHLLPHAQQAGA